MDVLSFGGVGNVASKSVLPMRVTMAKILGIHEATVYVDLEDHNVS